MGKTASESGKIVKASDLMVQALENEGIEYIFGIPGEENLDLLESLRHSKIKLVITRHEQAAGFMAATVGRLTESTVAASNIIRRIDKGRIRQPPHTCSVSRGSPRV